MTEERYDGKIVLLCAFYPFTMIQGHNEYKEKVNRGASDLNYDGLVEFAMKALQVLDTRVDEEEWL